MAPRFVQRLYVPPWTSSISLNLDYNVLYTYRVFYYQSTTAGRQRVAWTVPRTDYGQVKILTRAKCADDVDMKAFSAKLDQAKRDYNSLIERKTALTTERQDGITQYEDVYECIQPGDEDAVKTERQRLRDESEARISETVSKIYGERYDPKLLSDATKETDLDLVFDRRVEEHQKALHKYQAVDRQESYQEPER